MSRDKSQDRSLVLCEYTERYCDGTLSAEQTAELERGLRDDQSALDAFILYMEIHSQIAWNARAHVEDEHDRPLDASEGRGKRRKGRGIVGSAAFDLPVGAAVELPHQLDLESQILNPPFPSLSTTHYPLSTNFVGGPVFSYLTAAVILGVGILGAWAYKITRHQHVVKAPSPTAPASERPELVFVGRITGMVDVKWSADKDFLPPLGYAYVPLGRKYALASGLMEITYDSGAKVILEGPCTYEVESRAGGYLSLGKLTAKVESGEWRVEGAKPQAANLQVSNPQSLIPNPLFSVRTPTAIITDLGTEFGVEVAESGLCEVHLIKGRVQAKRIGAAAGTPGQEVQLSAGQAVRFAPDHKSPVFIDVAVDRFRAMRDGLVRKRKLRWPIADKTLVAWVSLANLSQQGGGVISIERSLTFDGIVYAELTPRKWMAASDSWLRAERDQSQNADEAADPEQLVRIAIVYYWNRITIYHNGRRYVQYYSRGRQTFDEKSVVLVGKRCADRTWRDPPYFTPTFIGSVEEARLYDVPLSAGTIASLRPNEPSPISPVGEWTFEDGTARDATGNFPPGELRGNARIADGKLILDGQDSYLFVPPARADVVPAESSGNNSKGENLRQDTINRENKAKTNGKEARK